MARQTDIRYVRLYTDGTAARKLDAVRPVAKTKLPKAKKQKKIVVHVDPVAMLGIVTAVVMLIVMTVSMFMLHSAQNRAISAQQQVEKLYAENQSLQDEYAAGYDLEAVERTALALGMVPVENVEHIRLHVNIHQNDKPDTAWDQFCAFLAGLFA